MRSFSPARESRAVTMWPSSDSADHLSGAGAVARLERRLRDLYGVKYALCVSSATSGLTAVALATGLRNSEIIAPVLTYGATLAGFLMLGNHVRFADVDPVTLCVDPADVEKLIGPRTKAIVSVDLFGVPSDSAALRGIADDHGLILIADAAQSFGATRGGILRVDADAHVLSFTVGKTLCAGEGGAVLTNRADLYERLVWHTQHPHRQRRDLGFDCENEFAVNCRIHPLAAACAEAAFDESLGRLRLRQQRAFGLVESLNESGLVEPLPFSRQSIASTFFRLSVARGKGVQPADVCECLREVDESITRDWRSLGLLPHSPSFRASSGRPVQRGTWPSAARQVKRRLQFAV